MSRTAATRPPVRPEGRSGGCRRWRASAWPRSRATTEPRDLGDQPAGAVIVQDGLQEPHGVELDLRAPFGERELCRHLTDDLAHGALGRRLHRRLGRSDVEQVFADVVDLPEHRVLDVDDVLVAGQHQPFFRHRPAAAAAHVGGRAEADVEAVDARDLRQHHGFDRCGDVPAQAGIGALHPLAEAQNHADLVGLHAVEAAGDPQRDRDHHDEADAAARAEAAGQHALHAILAAPQDLFDVGRLPAAEPATAAGRTSPRAGTAPAPGTTATALIPRHVLRYPMSLSRAPELSNRSTPAYICLATL